MARNKYDYDYFIIGGGTAGIRAAELLGAEGKRVGLANPDTSPLGGYESTDGYGERAPLVAAARLYAEIKNAPEMGIRGGSVGYNYPTLRQWSQDLSRRASGSMAVANQLSALGVQLYQSTARFIGPHEVALGQRHVSSAQFVVASGSRTFLPTTIGGLGTVKYLTPLNATDLLKPPKSLFIIGGGKSGVELASLFISFGTTVFIAEVAPRLLPDEDNDASQLLQRGFEARGAEVLTSTRVTSVAKESLMHRITYLRGDVEHVVKAEQILIATGRTPNLDLGLENAEVDYTPLGITVGPGLQTSNKNIYAAGSVTGTVSGYEGALLEGETAALNLLRRDKAAADVGNVPVAVYSQPEIARVGVNESEALRKDIASRTASVALADTVFGRAHRTDGFVKLVADKKGLIIGATAAGPRAADIINTVTLAIADAKTAETLARLPFAYGSAHEALSRAATRLTEI